MSSSFSSLDAMIANANAYGCDNVPIMDRMAAGVTTATALSGYSTIARFPSPYVLKSVTSPVTGWILTACNLTNSRAAGNFNVCFETLLAQGTLASNAFTSTSFPNSMPTRSVRGGTAVQLSATKLYAVVTTATSGATAAITVTYVNQAGTGSRTLTFTPPAAVTAVGTACDLMPYLQSGDTGVQSITAISTTAGTAGVIKFFGCIALSTEVEPSANAGFGVPVIGFPNQNIKLLAGDSIAFYCAGITSVTDLIATLTFTPEV